MLLMLAQVEHTQDYSAARSHQQRKPVQQFGSRLIVADQEIVECPQSIKLPYVIQVHLAGLDGELPVLCKLCQPLKGHVGYIDCTHRETTGCQMNRMAPIA